MTEEALKKNLDVGDSVAEKNVDQFGRQRSHEASKIAYDLCKVTAQSCLLINGGAATAVLALLSKEHVDANILRNVPWALSGYAVGVALSAVMMFCIMMMADNWNYYWYNWSYLGEYDDARKVEKAANVWHWTFYLLFAATIVLFLATSIFVGLAMMGARPT